MLTTKESKLVLLAIRTVDGGVKAAEVGLADTTEFSGFEVAKRIDNNDLSRLKELAAPNSEGFVIRFDSGFRVKVKFDEYVRLHRIMTGVNARRVWEVLSRNESLDEFLTNVPEEFCNYITKTKNELLSAYNDWYNVALKVYFEIKDMETRKQQANFLKEFNCRSIVFAMMDNKPFEHIIWKLIKPESTPPFRKDEDA